MLTPNDLKAIGTLIDTKLEDQDARMDKKLDQKFNEKLKPVYEFIEFAHTAIIAILEHLEDEHAQKIPQRIKKLEDMHPAGHHTS